MKTFYFVPTLLDRLFELQLHNGGVGLVRLRLDLLIQKCDGELSFKFTTGNKYKILKDMIISLTEQGMTIEQGGTRGYIPYITRMEDHNSLNKGEKFLYKIIMRSILYLTDPDMIVEAPSTYLRKDQESCIERIKKIDPNYIVVGFTFEGRKRTYTDEICEVSGYWRKKSNKNPHDRIFVQGYTKKFTNLKNTAQVSM